MPATKATLTKSRVEKIGTGAILWDSDVTGFGVRRQRDKLVYFLKTRIGGRQRWFSIGQHGSPWTVETARRRAREYLGDIAKGKDPAKERDLKAANPTMAVAVTEFLEREVIPNRKPTTAAGYRDILERLCLPVLGQIKVNAVLPRDIEGLRAKLRKTPIAANRSLAVLSSFFSWAEANGKREKDSNPVRGIKREKERGRERFLSSRELGRLGVALARAERQKSESPWALAAIRLLLFTGMRRGEVLTLKWQHVDIERAMLRLPETKTGPRNVYLSAPALEVLASVPRLAGNSFVIAGGKPGACLVNLAKPWKRICKVARLKSVRVHDLRHSFASVGAGGGVSLQMIGRLLGHSKTITTERYSHLAADPVRAANEVMAQQIAAMLHGRKGRVVHLAKTKNG